MEKIRRETFTGEFGLGLAPIMTTWHHQDVHQHMLSNSFIIHALTMKYEVTAELSQCFKMQSWVDNIPKPQLQT